MPFLVSCIITTASFDANSERNCLHIPHGSVFSCDEETIAIYLKDLCPSLTALTIAVRSAAILRYKRSPDLKMGIWGI